MPQIILVIDKDDSSGELLRDALAGKCTVLTVNSFEDAEKLSEKNSIAAAVDIGALGDISRLSRYPTLALSARAEDELRALENGARDFMVKPFNPKAAALRLEKLLDKPLNEPGDVINEAPCGITRIRVRGAGDVRLVYVNDTYCKIRGLSRGEILSEKLSDAYLSIHPDDISPVRASVETLIENGGDGAIQYRLRHSSGEYSLFNVFARACRDASGEMFLNAYYTDLSETDKRAKSTSDAYMRLLSAISDHATDLVFAKDMNYRYVCCSPAFVKFTGQRSAEDVIGHTDYDFFTKEEADRFRRDDELLYTSGKPLIDYVEPIPSDDGMQHYCTTSKYILRDASGAILGMYGIGRDITEYRTTFDRLKLLTDSISGGLITYAMTEAGIRIVYFNDGMCRLLGCTREEYERASRDNVITAVFEEDVPYLQKHIRAMVMNGSPINCVYRLRCMHGGYKWVNLRVGKVEKQDDLLYANAVIYDITEQKLAEEKARIHEEEMRFAMTQLGKMICEYDIAARALTMPKAYADRYGLDTTVSGCPDALIEEKHIDAEYIDMFRDMFIAMSNGEPTGAAEYRETPAGGGVRWERAEFSSILDDKKRPVKAILAIEETTAQHLQYELEQNKPKLGEENLLVHALFNLTTGETLEYAYRDGTVVPLCDRTALWFGGALPDELLINDEERRRYRELNDAKTLLAKFAGGETELSFDYRRHMPSGEVSWVRNIMRMVRKPGGSDVLLFDYFYLVEEEKVVQQMYSALITSNYDYAACVNGRTKRFKLYANEGVQYGMPPKSGDDIDAAAKALAEKNAHPEDREMVMRNVTVDGIKRNLKNREHYSFTYRLLRPDGTVRYKKLSQFYLDREREIIIVTREDVSSAVRAEIRKNEQLSMALASANQASLAKSQFLSRMSHELRTPMNAIIGLSALSATELNNPDAVADSIEKIGMSARYLLSLINDVLEMSRIESGRMTLSDETFDFEQLIASVNTIVYSQAQAKGLDYDTIVNNYTEPTYVGDMTKLQEILVNVLGNAIKFTPAGGKVTLTVEQLRCVNSRATMRFIVTDTGVGVDEEFIPKMFEPFSQELTGFTSASAGTGLGLAITKNLVEMMNGQISVKSIKNVGSVFTIDVQLGISREARRHIDFMASMNFSSIRALVVDDDVMVCKSTEGILRNIGIQAEWVDSGLRAVERVRKARADKADFDTIFIDWKMPDIDGIETTRRIRKIVGPEVTIIIITAYDWKSIETEAREAGADMFIDKPLFQSSIVKAFERVFMSAKDKVEPQPPVVTDLSGSRILLAEDHPLNVEVAKRLLEKAHAEVVVAANGLEALEIFTTSSDNCFDAILMDIRMPVMDGLTATKNIRKLKKAGSQSIPIIAMTANAFDEDVELSLSAGMNAHLAKPIEPQLLLSTLKRLMKRQ